jgi:hypothetical protein
MDALDDQISMNAVDNDLNFKGLLFSRNFKLDYCSDSTREGGEG